MCAAMHQLRVYIPDLTMVTKNERLHKIKANRFSIE